MSNFSQDIDFSCYPDLVPFVDDHLFFKRLYGDLLIDVCVFVHK